MKPPLPRCLAAAAWRAAAVDEVGTPAGCDLPFELLVANEGNTSHRSLDS